MQQDHNSRWGIVIQLSKKSLLKLELISVPIGLFWQISEASHDGLWTFSLNAVM